MNKETFYRIIDIGNAIINESENFHQKIKEAMNNYSQDTIKRIENLSKNGQQNLRIINSYKDDYLVFWNESINKETEIFWQKIEAEKIEVERKEPLKYALLKNHFRNVNHGIDARKNWNSIIEFGYINKRFTKDQIKQLKEIIDKDERQRLNFLRKCYKKRKISSSGYLKFRDSVTYFNNCDLFKKYFDSNQVDELMKIWIQHK